MTKSIDTRWRDERVGHQVAWITDAEGTSHEARVASFNDGEFTTFVNCMELGTFSSLAAAQAAAVNQVEHGPWLPPFASVRVLHIDGDEDLLPSDWCDSLESWQEQANTAYEAEDWQTYLKLFSGFEQLTIFAQIASKLGDAEYWRLLGESYSRSFLLPERQYFVRELFASDRPGRQYMMTPYERRRLRSLPDEIIAFRGYGTDLASRGWSWTLSRKLAIGFSRRGDSPRVAEARIAKKDVIAYIARLREQEIVVDPDAVVLTRVDHVDPSA